MQILEAINEVLAMATPCLLGMALVAFSLGVATSPGLRRWRDGLAGRLRQLAPLDRFVLLLAACLSTWFGGAKESGGGDPDDGDGSGVELRQIIETPLRSLPEPLSGETNALTITSFTVSSPSNAVSFGLSWTTNYFAGLDSRYLDLFMSTNLLERRWFWLGEHLMPEGVTSNVVMALPPAITNSTPRTAFFRFGADFDADGDGLTDAYERMASLTSPVDYDTDGDGLSDGEELSAAIGTDPLDPDTDGDGVLDGDEIAAGANPLSASSDADALADGEEIGTMALLAGVDFLWLDLTNAVNLIEGRTRVTSGTWTVPLNVPAFINNVAYTNAKVCLHGLVHLLCPTNEYGYTRTSYSHSGGLANRAWSDDHVTVALCNAHLMADVNGWGSRILCGSAEAGGKTYAAIEYRNIGLRSSSFTNELITCQLIIPADETNAVYVSYLCASNAFRAVDLMCGVQCAALPSFHSGEDYYNLTWPLAHGFPQDGMTIRYAIGTGTDPTMADTDGDGLDDGAEWGSATDPLNPDTDGDGIADGAEMSLGTNPLSTDTDGDGIPDGWEYEQGLNPLSANGDDGAGGDPDSDGLANIHEYRAGTDPSLADTDGDGLSDADESAWWEYCQPLSVFDVSGGTNLLESGIAYSTNVFTVPLPFPVNCGGGIHTNIAIGINGAVGLLAAGRDSEFNIPNTNRNLDEYDMGDDHVAIAAYWDNLYVPADSGAKITLADVSTNGLRHAVVEYSGIRLYTYHTYSYIAATIQIVIPEAETNVVYVNYINLSDYFDGRSASIGAQRPSATIPVSYNTSGAVSNGVAIAYHLGFGSSPLAADTDCDGIADAAEVAIGTNPGLADTDGDGLDDAEEATIGTDPLSPDTDGDGLPDSWEAANSLDPLSPVGSDGAGGDPDGDGLSNEGEWQLGTSPVIADTDGDCLSDYAEWTGGTDPLDPDTDGDGLSDGAEVALGTNPMSLDSDGDGLPDKWEVEHVPFDPLYAADGLADPDCDGLSTATEVMVWQTEWQVADTDGDGLGDGAEVTTGTSPIRPDTDFDGLSDSVELALGTNPTQPDTDGDGMDDGWERRHGFNALVDNATDNDPDNDYGADPDGDGLTNGEECQFDTDPDDADTDGDGVDDGAEAANGSDPGDAGDGGEAHSRIAVDFEFGDYSGSHSEKYCLVIEPIAGEGEPPASYSWLNAWYAGTDTRRAYFKPGWKYRVRLQHSSTNPSYSNYPDPDYDYRLRIVSDTDAANVLLYDPEEMFLGNKNSGASFTARDSVAHIYALEDSMLVADYDRDGAIGSGDNALAASGRRLRFWVNDDEDSLAVGGNYSNSPRTDIPCSALGLWGSDTRDPDCSDHVVNGRCDLMDFTPVYMDVSPIQILPEEIRRDLSFKLKNHDGAVNVVWTGLAKGSAGIFLTGSTSLCGTSLEQNAYEAQSVSVTRHGTDVPDDMAALMIEDDTDKGVVFIEGGEETDEPLVLEIWYEGEVVSRCELPMTLSPVGDMYYFYSLRGSESNPDFQLPPHVTPPNLMDGSNGKTVFFLHGLSVGIDEARGWSSEMFKRLWQSGSNARFMAVTWFGNYNWLGNWSSGLNYHDNARNAFMSADALKSLVEREQPTSGGRVLMAHSLGNMVVCEALRMGLSAGKYFMLDAAVPSEAIDGTLQAATSQDDAYLKYVPSDWHGYTNLSWASNWHRWFEANPNDKRGEMGWPDFFADALGNVGTVYNYYSSGDPVFMENATVPDLTTGVFHWQTLGWTWPFIDLKITAEPYCWQKQETRKGISSVAGTLNGGWGFHIWDTYDPDEGVILTYHSAGEAAAMVESRAITNHPVFEITGTSLNNPNATVADIREALAKHIPAVSSAVGKTNLGGSSIFCDDLNGSAYRSGWGRNDGFFPNLWLHSDLKDMAYHYVFPFFTELACRGELK